jgi:hypothetical protein
MENRIMLSVADMPTQARLFVKRTPWLYRPAKRLTGRGAADHLCDRATDLCIEGYPSSGNSFSFAVLCRANGGLRIAHHCHSVANFQLAFDYGIPAVCLIRRPEDAIASRLARFQGAMRSAILEYVSFYDFVLAHRDRLTVVTFDEVTRHTGIFLDRVAQATGLPFDTDDIAQIRESATDYMTRWTERNAEPENISLPRAERDRAKAKLLDEIRGTPPFGHAQLLWRRITCHSPSPPVAAAS